MSNPLAVRTMWLVLGGLMMTISAHAIERPPSVDSLDQETRNILEEKNRIGGFVATVDAKTRLAVDKFQVISARGEILGQSRLVDPNALSSFVMRATVPVGGVFSAHYYNSTVVFVGTVAKDPDKAAYEDLYVVVYIPPDPVRGPGFVKRVVSAVHTVDATY